MGINVGKIKSGLMRLKQIMNGGSSRAPIRVPTTPFGQGRSAMAPPATTFYSAISASPPRSMAPPPMALPSLAPSFYDTIEPNSPDAQIHALLAQQAPGAPAETTTSSAGPLALTIDLKPYEDFVNSDEMQMKDMNHSAQYRDLLNPYYGLERDTASHTSAHLMITLINYWKLHFLNTTNPITFTDFITRVSEDDLLQIWNVPNKMMSQELIRRFKQGVRYLDGTKREKYNVVCKNKVLYWAKWGSSRPLDTTINEFYQRKHEHLTFNKDSFAIWVLSREQQLYTHAAKVHRFHHSSFTSGDLIMCGGDWHVENGKLRWISAASGHYRPTFEHLRNAVQVLANRYGISANDYQIKLVPTGPGSTAASELVPASKLLFDLSSLQQKYALAEA